MHLFFEKAFPFGTEPAGGVFAFNKKQEVVLFDAKDYYCEQDPEVIAETFAEFIGECLMGKRYHEFDSIIDNQYYDFLKHLGWV